jgi:hypothetical protein
MTLQLLHSEFPYIYEVNFILFFIRVLDMNRGDRINNFKTRRVIIAFYLQSLNIRIRNLQAMRKNPGTRTIIKAAKMCKNFRSRAKIAGGPVRQPYPRVDFPPQSGTMN